MKNFQRQTFLQQFSSFVFEIKIAELLEIVIIVENKKKRKKNIIFIDIVLQHRISTIFITK